MWLRELGGWWGGWRFSGNTSCRYKNLMPFETGKLWYVLPILTKKHCEKSKSKRDWDESKKSKVVGYGDKLCSNSYKFWDMDKLYENKITKRRWKLRIKKTMSWPALRKWSKLKRCCFIFFDLQVKCETRSVAPKVIFGSYSNWSVWLRIHCMCF